MLKIRQIKFSIAFILLFMCFAFAAKAQTTLSGTITDPETGEGLIGVSVGVKGTPNGTITDADGNFSLNTSVRPPFKLIFSSVGYATQEYDVNDSESDIKIELASTIIIGEEVVISATRKPEKLTESPSTISVITSEDFAKLPSFNVGELASKIQGVEFVRTGVNGVGINARGFNNAFNAKILAMTDGRNSMMAGGSGLPAGIMNTVIKEDIERVEVVLGPNSALYGPNAHNGVVNTITKDPRKYQGLTFALTGGNQDVFSGRLRYAQVVNKWLAFKVSGEYTSGRDFEFLNKVYSGANVYDEKDVNFNFKHLRGEAAAYISVKKDNDIIISWGGSQNSFLSVNNVGRNQIRDWRFYYLQARYVSNHWFAQLYNTWTDVGTSYAIGSYTTDYNARILAGDSPQAAETYALRLGNQFKEFSTRLNGEIQYNNSFAGFNYIASVSYQHDAPNTFGTSIADAPDASGNQKLITIDQIGGAIQVDKAFGKFKIVASARLDNHSTIGNMFAPKAALLYNALGGTFRFTWGKAFAAPLILFQYANLLNGFVFGNGPGVTYIPNGQSTSVKTDKLRPEEISTFELGYKGVIANKKLFLDFNGWYSNTLNFLSPALTVLGRAISLGDIPVTPLLAGGTGAVPTGASFFSYFNYGQVTSYGVDLGVNYYIGKHINIGVKYSWFGSDITDKNNLKNDANRDGYVSDEEATLNAPANRGVVSLGLDKLLRGRLFVNASVRFVEKFNFFSGSQIGTDAGKGSRGQVLIGPGTNQITGVTRTVDTFVLKNFNNGPLGDFATVDLSAGFKIQPWVSIGAGVSNLFGVDQREFVASPLIGRLFSAEVRFDLMQKK